MFVLPRLLQRQHRSAVINVSSSTYYTPGGMVPVYSATKAYNFALSEAMRDQYGGKLDILTVTPASTATQMNSGRYVYSVSAESHAKATINQLGWADRTRGTLVHALQPHLNSIWFIGTLVNSINARRRQQWLDEEKAKETTKNLVHSRTQIEPAGK